MTAIITDKDQEEVTEDTATVMMKITTQVMIITEAQEEKDTIIID
jgi:hypothetical protein